MRKNSRFGQLMAACLFVALCVTTPAWANEEEAPKKAAGTEFLFVKMNPISIPVIRKNGTTSMLALDILAEVKDEDAKEKVEASKPRLRDAFIRALYGNLETNKMVREDGALDMDMVRKRLLQGSLYVLKEPAITDILFSGVNHRAF